MQPCALDNSPRVLVWGYVMKVFSISAGLFTGQMIPYGELQSLRGTPGISGAIPENHIGDEGYKGMRLQIIQASTARIRKRHAQALCR